MTTNDSSNPRLAVLIDADNARSSAIPGVLREISRYGVATVKRVYGDWTTTNLKGWKECLNAHALRPIQQFAYTSGKNSTDAALIIDAMDLLHSGCVDGFCLVSSDSDFTRLATRIREAGLAVYGFGEQKTPIAFAAACDKFTEIRGGDKGTEPANAPGVDATGPLEGMLRNAVTAAKRDDGWSPLAVVGDLLNKTNPHFDSRKYGFRQLGKLVHAQPYLAVKSVPSEEGGVGSAKVYVRLNENTNSL